MLAIVRKRDGPTEASDTEIIKVGVGEGCVCRYCSSTFMSSHARETHEGKCKSNPNRRSHSRPTDAIRSNGSSHDIFDDLNSLNAKISEQKEQLEEMLLQKEEMIEAIKKKVNSIEGLRGRISREDR